MSLSAGRGGKEEVIGMASMHLLHMGKCNPNDEDVCRGIMGGGGMIDFVNGQHEIERACDEVVEHIRERRAPRRV
jgi:hypothetical protein